jgi:hypothetical protein
MARSWAIAVLATGLLLASAAAAGAQLRVGPETDLSAPGLGTGPTLSYDSTRSGWLAFWFSDGGDVYDPDPRLISRYINPDLRPKHDSNTQFDVGHPWTAAYDPVAEEHVLTTGGGYGSTASVRRFSPMGVLTGGAWKLEPGSMAPSVALDPRTGAGIVAYITEPEFDEGTTVWAQRLAPAGGPQGAPVRLSQLAAGVKVDLHRPAVAFNAARGEFAVAWRERRSGIGAFVGDIVMTRMAASVGGPIGVPAAISDSRSAIVAQDPPGEIPDGAGAPGLAYDAATGGYLATWLAARGDVLESATQVYGQRLDGELREVGPDDFRISAGPGVVDLNAFPTVVANDGMVVVWRRWIGDEPQVVGRRVTDGAPAEPVVLWTNGAYGLYGSPELAGPATGPLLLGMAVDTESSWDDRPQVRLVGDGADPGSARIADGPQGTSASRSATFTFEGAPSLECRLNDDAWRTCQPTHVFSELGDDVYHLQVRARGPGGWVQAEPASHEWRVESGPPDTRITQIPAVKDRPARFDLVADEPASLECRVDDAPWAPCDLSGRRGYESVTVTDGLHRFEARATDDAGHVDPTPATWIWTHDSDPPETWIDDGPTGVVLLPAIFVLRSDEPGVRYECTDHVIGQVGETWSPCESGVPFPVSRGSVRARAIDAAGNVDESPASWRWFAERGSPTVEELSATGLGPDRTSLSRDVTIKFRIGSVSADSTVEECRLDGGLWQRCASPHRMEGLSDGAHVFEARSTSRAGVVGPVSPFAFSVDTQRPTTYIFAKPRVRTLLRTARFEFGATRPATFTCHVDGVARPCTSPLVLDDLTVGQHTIRIRATGAGGWTEPLGPLDYIWNVVSDPNAPMTAQGRRAMRALAAAAPETLLDTAPASHMRTNTALFEWDWLDTDDVVGSECTLDGAAWTPCSSPWRLEGLSEGGHHFEIRTVNRAGERDPTPVAVDWTVDTITAHVVWEAGPSSRTRRDPVTIAFRADRDGATFECRTADAAFQPCTSPYTATGQPEGAYRLIVRAVNRGLIGPARTLDWIVDRTPPDTELRSQRISPGMTTSRREIDYEVRVLDFAMEEMDGFLEPEFYFEECRLDGGPWAWCPELGNPLENLADGPHVLEARATDYAGNVDATPARIEWTVDTGAADTFIDTGPPATGEDRSATFTLRAQPAGGGFECRLDGGAWRACEATHTITGVADGSHTLEARAIGGPPDATPARWSWTVDAEPTPTVLSGPLERTADSTARFGLAADDAAARIECRLDGGAWQTCGTAPEFPGLADGDHTLEVRAVDGGGRTGVLAQPWRWSVDTQAPDTLLVSAPDPVRRWRDAEIAFRSDEPGTRFQCRLDGAAWATCRSPHWIGGLSDATHTLDVRAVDAIGNADATPVSASWRVDTTAPFGQLTASPPLGWRHGTKITAATFTATGNEPLSAVECRVDERPWAPCRDGATFGGFAEGPHQAEARLVDEAGNVGYTDVMPWSNGRPVDTEILRRPKAAEFSTSATFEYSGDSFFSSVAFRCSLDGGPWESCSTQPRSYSNLALGHHVFEVATVDADGDLDATPARWEWDIYPQPETTITEGPPAGTTDTSARFTFSSDQPGSTFQCKLDSASGFTACPNPYTITGLTEGPHTLLVSARGPAGNMDHSPAAWNWTVTAAGTTTSTPQVARGAAEAVSRALAGRRWRSVLSGRRPVVVAGAPGVLTIRVRARSRLVAGATLRMTVAGRRDVALRPYRRPRPVSRARVQASWLPPAGPRQEWRLTTTIR